MARRIRKGSDDVSYASAIMGIITTTPRNLFYAIYNPVRTNFKPHGELPAKVIKASFYPAMKFLQKYAFWDPRLKDKMWELEKLDVDSHKYIYPILDQIDDVILDKLEPLRDDPKTPGSIYNELLLVCNQLEQLSHSISGEESLKNSTSLINSAHSDITKIKAVFGSYKTQTESDLAPVKTAISAVPDLVNPAGVVLTDKTYRASRKATLVEQADLVIRQFGEIFDALNTAETDVVSLRTIKSPDNFKNSLSTIVQRIQDSIKYSNAKSSELYNDATIRNVRIGEKNPDGTDKSLNYSAEQVRKLKRSVDVRYVNPHVRMLPKKEASAKADNAENYFIMTVEYWKNAFDANGKFIPVTDRQEQYTTTIAKNLANMYRSGREQDALRAIQYLMFHESQASNEIIPGDLAKALTDQLNVDFKNAGLDIAKDKHFSYFNQKVTDLLNERDHSPRVGGPRDAQKWWIDRAKKYYYGRMYPGPNEHMATPYKNDKIEKPILRFRQKLYAAVTGRTVVPMSETGRTAKTPAEVEGGFGIKESWLSKAFLLRFPLRVLTLGVSSLFDRGTKSWPLTKKGAGVLVALGALWGGEKAMEQVTGPVNADIATRIGALPLKVLNHSPAGVYALRPAFSIVGYKNIPGSDWTFGSHGDSPSSSPASSGGRVIGGESKDLELKRDELQSVSRSLSLIARSGLGNDDNITRLGKIKTNLERQVKVLEYTGPTEAELIRLRMLPADKQSAEVLKKIKELDESLLLHFTELERLETENEEIQKGAEKKGAMAEPAQTPPNKTTGLAGMFNSVPAQTMTMKRGELARLFSGEVFKGKVITPGADSRDEHEFTIV